MEVQRETQNQTRQDADAKTDAVLSKYLCSKCGKEYRRGMYFHQKFCKG
jgi:hypothetical protein